MEKNTLIRIGDFIKPNDGNDIFRITNIETSFHGTHILQMRDKDNRRYVSEAYSLEWGDRFNAKRFTQVDGF